MQSACAGAFLSVGDRLCVCENPQLWLIPLDSSTENHMWFMACPIWDARLLFYLHVIIGKNLCPGHRTTASFAAATVVLTVIREPPFLRHWVSAPGAPAALSAWTQINAKSLPHQKMSAIFWYVEFYHKLHFCVLQNFSHSILVLWHWQPATQVELNMT